MDEVITLNTNDYITKDNKHLSYKQILILHKNNILNVNNMTYEEVSNKIGAMIREWKEFSQGKGDRGFDDDQFWDYHFPYSESELC